jgi:dihydrolipoamide dehydrogenase
MAQTTQIAVLGAGPGGYAAAFYAADLGMQVTLIDEEKNPAASASTAAAFPRRRCCTWRRWWTRPHMRRSGRDVRRAAIDVNKLRAYKQGVVDKLTAGVGSVAKLRKGELRTGARHAHRTEVADW